MMQTAFDRLLVPVPKMNVPRQCYDQASPFEKAVPLGATEAIKEMPELIHQPHECDHLVLYPDDEDQIYMRREVEKLAVGRNHHPLNIRYAKGKCKSLDEVIIPNSRRKAEDLLPTMGSRSPRCQQRMPPPRCPPFAPPPPIE